MKLKVILSGVAFLAAGFIAQVTVPTTIHIHPEEILHDEGFGYSYSIPAARFKVFSVAADTLSHPRASKTRLFENDQSLNPAHSLREDIQTFGGGRFSHWKKNRLYFSASDNSDPRKNGRRYSAKIQTGFAPWIQLPGLAMIFLTTFGMLFLYLRWSKLLSGFSRIAEKNPFAMMLFYVAIIMLVNMTASLFLYQGRVKTAFSPSLFGNVTNKQAAYMMPPSKYDFVFVGDSRTYTDIQPFILNKILKTLSINLAGFTNWFPTQFPHYQDLAPIVSSDRVVVWSVGHQNFRPGGLIQTQYPIGFKNVPRYLSYGFKFSQLWTNLSYFNPLTQVFDQAKKLRSLLDQETENVFFSTSSHTANQDTALEKENERIKGFISVKKYLNDPLIIGKASHAFNLGTDGKVNSMAITFNDGSYYLVELNPAYFRNKQADMARSYDKAVAKSGLSKPFEPDAAYWKLFLAMLELFERNHVRLIVNEIEEAPFTYINREKREWCRAFMRQVVQPEVERRGHAYLRANWDAFTDADYFDYNHLNAQGAKKYSEMLAELLKPILRAGT